VVAVNPDPLPSTALIQFNPVPVLDGIPSGPATFLLPIKFQGNSQEDLVSPSIGVPPTTLGHLNIVYSLQGAATETIIPPGPTATQPGSFSATFTITGKVTEILTPPGLGPQQAWAITTTISEHGTVSGPLTPPDGTDVHPMNFTLRTDLTQIERSAVSAAGGTPWLVRATVNSTGAFQVREIPSATPVAGFSLVAPFTDHDLITESLSPVSPVSVPPRPPIQILATNDAAGTVTEHGFNLGPAPTVSGTTQYHSQLHETITYPPGPTDPGSTQSLTQTLDTTGDFQNFIFFPPGVALAGLPGSGDGSPSMPAAN
jgi:hypothetical protein